MATVQFDLYFKKKETFMGKLLSLLNRRIKSVLKDQRGSVDILIILFTFFCCVTLAFPFSKVFITYSNLNSMAKIVVEDVEFRGLVDTETHLLIQRKLADASLSDLNPMYKFTGDIKPSGKIQLQDEFTFEVAVTEKLTFANFTGHPFSIEIPITKKIDGVSQNYYRASEL